MREVIDRPSGFDGAPPTLPPDLIDVDEGPMRRELKRQIAQLERELAELSGELDGFAGPAASPSRGPAILTTAQLELVRDELLAARARLVAGVP